jgi:CRP-like cAMP-binding protein
MAQPPLSRKNFQPGYFIFREGGAGDQAYLVQKGLVEIIRQSGDGHKVLRRVGVGEVFGAMAAIDSQVRIASARAVEESVCVVITRRVLEEKIAASDPFIVALLRWFVAQSRGKALH